MLQLKRAAAVLVTPRCLTKFWIGELSMSHSTRTPSSHQESSSSDNTKTCRACGRTLDRAQFYARSDSPDGLRNDCKDCTKERARLAVQRNPEKRKEYMRQYGEVNRAHLNEQARVRFKRNDRKLYSRQYRAQNRQSVLENERRYRVQNRHKETARRLVRRSAMPVDDATIEYLRILRGDICSYCGKSAGTVDHIVPVADGGTNDWDNLTSACSSCNSRKHDRSLLTFLVKLYDE